MMNRQAAFNAAVRGLVKQKCFSIDPNTFGCLYRGPEGHRCAIGMLIPDRNYDSDFECESIYHDPVYEAISTRYIPNLDDLEDNDLSFLDNLQNCLHDDLIEDDFSIKTFKQAAKTFAGAYKLKVDAKIFK